MYNDGALDVLIRPEAMNWLRKTGKPQLTAAEHRAPLTTKEGRIELRRKKRHFKTETVLRMMYCMTLASARTHKYQSTK